eukprot:symbB.v1.2.004727.t1/scaffold219.1/size262806/7
MHGVLETQLKDEKFLRRWKGASREESWVWPLRAERQKEPRFQRGPVKQPRQARAPVVSQVTLQEDTQTLEEAINALTEAIHEPVEFPLEPKKRQKSRREASQKEIKVHEVEASLHPEESLDVPKASH